MRAPIHSKKHYIQKSLTTVLASAADVTTLVSAADIPTSNNFDVETGSLIKALFVELWIRGQDTSPGSVLASIVKTVDGQTITFADHANLNDYSNKRNVIYHTQGLTNLNAADAIPFIRQWFKIPKGKQRMALGDNWRLVVSAQALDVNICGFATYKEIS